MSPYAQLVYLMAPIILAGIGNMVLVKLPVLSSLKKPIDGGLLFSDGRRILGDNKTWKGFFGMVALTALCTGAEGLLFDASPAARELSLLPFEGTSALWMGACLGLGYALAELPNSFAKRRIGIAPGRNASGALGALFVVIDQADSVVGCIVAARFFYPLAAWEAAFLLLFGTAVHYGLNVLLFFAGLRKQAG